VQLDVFVDFLCPDCAEAFPTLLSLASMYEFSLRITVHPFPLPYHRNAFLAAKAARIVGQTGSAAFFSFASILWKNLDEFSGDRADNFTVTHVIDRLGDLASDWMKPDEFVNAMQNPRFEADSRVDWKYGCSRAVYGTPTYHLNGVYISASPAWTTAHWRKIIDPLL
jgi:protein-disulfide isomerase